MERPNWVPATAVIMVGLLTLLAFVSVASFAVSYIPGTTVDVALVVVLAVIALISSVAFVVVAFSFFGLHDRQHALGLPEGSVRALVAMMLVILFAIFAAYYFDRLGAGAQPAQADFAKQVLVLIGTLVTAVVSFYFASRTSAESMASADDSPSNAPSVVNVKAPDRPAGDPLNTGETTEETSAHLPFEFP